MLVKRIFGTNNDSHPVDLFTLTTGHGLELDVMTYGAIVVGLRVPDRHGVMADVTLGFSSLEPYLTSNPYFGAIVGRYANRIAGGSFALNGTTYHLACNDGPNHLHGGERGFDKAIWTVAAPGLGSSNSLTLAHRSLDGDEGYPGQLDVAVTYSVTDDHTIRIDYHATTDHDTVINLSNHTYFNLAGHGDILQHELRLMARTFLPVGGSLIPTGEFRPVAGTPMDFSTAMPIGARLPSSDEQVALARGGYDHCWIVDGERGGFAHAAHVCDPSSGHVMDVFTTQPGIQFYTGNFLDGSLIGRAGRPYHKHAGFCLETQHFPDSPNHATFPSTVLRVGDVYQQSTEFVFGIA